MTREADATYYFYLKSLETGIDMKKYHTICAPKYCEFLEKQDINIAFLLGVIIGVAGSISAFCKASCGALAKRGIKKKVGTHVENNSYQQ